MIVLDTGVLYAAADEDDDDHGACAELLTGRAGELVVPVPVLVETAWLLERRLGPEVEALFLRAGRRRCDASIWSTPIGYGPPT
ncbi:MAG: PIN domain-containing protein [Actinomycetes bacterium]